MVTARQKVLTYLTKNRTASAREISRSTKMSTATVRHHLRVLASDGRLEMESVRGRDGRGRPEKVYSIPRAALGDNLSALADALLTEAGKSVRVDALAKRLAGESDFERSTNCKAAKSCRREIKSNELSCALGSGGGGTSNYFWSLPIHARCEEPS